MFELNAHTAPVVAEICSVCVPSARAGIGTSTEPKASAVAVVAGMDRVSERTVNVTFAPAGSAVPKDRRHWRNNYSRSVTFQYASLMNFDQLAIRTLWSA